MRKINGFSNYAADEDGHIYSLNYKRTGKVVKVKPAHDANGYLRTMLKGDDGKYHTIKVHRIIALVFYGESNGLTVNHKNGIKDDNRAENLEYATRSQNVQHAYDNGLAIGMKGERNPNSKLTEKQVEEIRQYRASFKGRYYNRKMLAEKYGVSELYIKEIVNRRRNVWSGQ